ncbi:MAG: hypothetical protein J6V50_06500 [Clostridia bacterium]|nr:hypothetical protein [Clostridia bacterium]
MNKAFKILIIAAAFVLALTFSGCDKNAPTGDTSSVVESDISVGTIKITEVSVRGAETRSIGAGQAVEKLSLTPLTESASFTVKEAVNYKWIAYDNYTVVEHFEKGTALSDTGYLFYIELPKTDFAHEMYLEFFSSREKVGEYSGETAYTESGKVWYSLPQGGKSWVEHTTEKYKLCFNDGGEEYKGYVFIPAESLTYRNNQKTLSDIAVYVKTGVETGSGDAGSGLTFSISTVMPLVTFDKNTTIAQSKLGRFNLSDNTIMQ